MSGKQKEKGGGARKYGRNKAKCERYRTRKRSYDSRKHRKYRLTDQHRVQFIIDSALVPENKFDSYPTFKPRRERDHLATELVETASKMHSGSPRAKDYKDISVNVVRPLRNDLRDRVTVVPKEVK